MLSGFNLGRFKTIRFKSIRFKKSNFKAQPISLRVLLTLPVVLQMSCAVSLVSIISFQNGQKSVNTLVFKLQKELSATVNTHLDQFFALPQQINSINAATIQEGHLKPNQLEEAGHHFCNQAQIFPHLSYIGFNWSDGRGAGAGRWVKDAGLLISEDANQRSKSYHADSECQRSALQETLNYSPLTDAWYSTTAAKGKANWGPIDISDGYKDYIAISANKPVYDKQNKLIGILNIDLLLPSINSFLRSVLPSKNSLLFIVGQNGELVATSAPIIIGPKTNAVNAPIPLVQKTSQFLIRKFGSFEKIQRNKELDFSDNGDRYFLQLQHWLDEDGLNLLVVSVLPESDFNSAIQENIRQTILVSAVALLITVAMGALTANWLSQPIKKVISAIGKLASGNWQDRLDHSQIQELNQLSNVFNQMASQMRLSFTTLEYNARHDSLTGLLNQGAFRSQLQDSIDKHSHSEHKFAIMFLDLDNFKYINDSFGHLVGDMLLVDVSKRLQDCLRTSDVIARFGGDEFVILIEKVDSIEDAVQVSNRIAIALEKPFTLDEQEVFISTSIGIMMGQDSDADRILANADWALYSAKEKGKGSHVIFGEHLQQASMERIQLETELRHAIERSEFEVYYQPIVDLKNRAIYGFEALIRWHHPKRGFVSPNDFIPIAEETGLIVPMDWWVLEQSCQQLHDWQYRFNRPDLTMSVNLSQKQFSQPDFVENLAWVLQSVGLAPETLKLEITERIMMENDASAKLRTKELREMGVQLSIDDFGTGYSSLSRLQELPINTLKIDRSFISHLSCDDDSIAIVNAIAAIAQSLRMTVIVEGIETEYQCDRLRDMGCNQGQGYLFSRPVAVVQATALLEKAMDADRNVIESFIASLTVV